MKMKVDNIEVEVAEGTTVLAAAREAGVSIPNMCYIEGQDHFTSCMVCLVRERSTGAVIPACSAKVAAGMDIEASSDEVRQLRRDSLELLLSEHVGDCVGPCTLGCPAHMDIPQMLRQIADGDMAGAATTVRERLALPSVLAHVCPAPCEKTCRRRRVDTAVSIRTLVGHAAAGDLVDAALPGDGRLPTGKHVAIVGAGTAGLAAANYLVAHGHWCTIFDDHEEPGGMLRYGMTREELPASVLDAEIDRLRKMGITFEMGVKIGVDRQMAELRDCFDAVVLAAGRVDLEQFKAMGVDCSAKGVVVDSATMATSQPGVFAGGNAVRELKMAVRAVADGRAIADSVDWFLKGEKAPASRREFNSVMGRLADVELTAMMQLANSGDRADDGAELNAKVAADESCRCLHCDCRKADNCELRRLSDEYAASQRKFAGGRPAFEQVVQHPEVVYESAKCIKCGICVRITAAKGEALGLAFESRGFDVRVGVPFGESLDRGLTESAAACVNACPTGALSKRSSRSDQ